MDASRSQRQVRWIAIGSFCLVGLICAVLFVRHVFSDRSDAIRWNGRHLANVRKLWLSDGSPPNPDVSKYTSPTNTTSRTFVDTNAYNIDGRNFDAIFAVESERFRGEGFLVISREGQLIWVGRDRRVKLVRD
jgi:hypothetical protein